MVKKTNKPVNKFGLGLLVIFLLAGLLAPSATGYVNNPSTDTDKDMQSSVILENAIVRLVDSGELILSQALTSEMVEARIKRVLGDVPEIQQAEQHFCMNVQDGSVNAKKEKGPGEIIINNVSGD